MKPSHPKPSQATRRLHLNERDVPNQPLRSTLSGSPACSKPTKASHPLHATTATEPALHGGYNRDRSITPPKPPVVCFTYRNIWPRHPEMLVGLCGGMYPAYRILYRDVWRQGRKERLMFIVWTFSRSVRGQEVSRQIPRR